MNIITREQLEYTARKVLKYSLQDAEKDYMLGQALLLIQNSQLASQLVFKGGTAIHHCFLDQLRFSEDLDFSAIDKDIEFEAIKAVLESEAVFEIMKEYMSPATFKIERLKYYGILDTPNSIKIEVDRIQSTYLPARMMRYNNVWGWDFKVTVMDPVEVCAEKIRACSDRFRYRDFYDLYLLVHEYGVDIEQAIKILPKKEIRKPISQGKIVNNLTYALEEAAETSDTVSYKQTVADTDLVNFLNKLDIPELTANFK